MTLHSLAAYIEYKWKATSRHGVHSPFVYDLIDHVVLDKALKEKAVIPSIGRQQFLPAYKALLSAVATYYNCEVVYCIDNSDSNVSPEIDIVANKISGSDLLWINLPVPDKWIELYEINRYWLSANSIVAVSNIHASRLHTFEWEKLKSDPAVKLSIDLYNMGLLFFRQSFKEKQHFVLRYP